MVTEVRMRTATDMILKIIFDADLYYIRKLNK